MNSSHESKSGTERSEQPEPQKVESSTPAEIKPKVGQYLYASCSGQDYGKIIDVGQDDNGTPTIDIEWYDQADMGSTHEAWEDKFPEPNLMQLVVPKDAVLILTSLQYRDCVEHNDGEVTLVCNTPGNGCYRCSKLFWLRDEPTTAKR